MYDVSHLPRWWRWYVYIPLPHYASSFEDEMDQALSVVRGDQKKLPGIVPFVYEDYDSIPIYDETGDYGLIVKIYIPPGTCTKSDPKGRKRVIGEAETTIKTTLEDPLHRRADNVVHNYSEWWKKIKD